jgi:hypothetical protein
MHLGALMRSSPKPDDAGSDALPPMSSLASEPVAARNEPNDLATLRDLLIGPLPELYASQIERLETRIAESASEFAIALAVLERRLEKRILAVDAASRAGDSELREQLFDEMRVVNEAIQTCHAQAVDRFERGLEEVRNAKLDHAAFASFLEGLARHLSREDAVRTEALEAR